MIENAYESGQQKNEMAIGDDILAKIMFIWQFWKSIGFCTKPLVDEIWCRYVKAFMSYAWSYIWQTSKQSYKQSIK